MIKDFKKVKTKTIEYFNVIVDDKSYAVARTKYSNNVSWEILNGELQDYEIDNMAQCLRLKKITLILKIILNEN